jgi:hypothetical protein
MVAMLRDRCALERERMQRWGSDAFGEIEAYADLGSGSDRTGAPAGIVTELRPPKVTAWIEPGLTLVELFGAATVPEPIRRVRSRIRSKGECRSGLGGFLERCSCPATEQCCALSRVSIRPAGARRLPRSCLTSPSDGAARGKLVRESIIETKAITILSVYPGATR